MKLRKILKEKKLFIILFFAILFFSNVVCKKEGDTPPIDTGIKKDTPSIKFVKQGQVFFQDKDKKLINTIDAEIAETDETRHRGLMFRDKMEQNQGMLFIFNTEEPQGFYMKNTLIPLDIIFVNSKKEIVKIYKNTTPLSEEDLPSIKPILYVVEVNGGYCDKNNVKEGCFIDWKRD